LILGAYCAILPNYMITTENPFIFYSRLRLIELTGVRSKNLKELLGHLKTVNGSCIYYHTHHFLQRHEFVSPEPPNDFAYWVSEVLGDDNLGEELASIDIIAHPTIRSIRESIIDTIEKSIKARPRLKNLEAPEGEEFNFLKATSFVFSANHEAKTLKEFRDCLDQISNSSIYFHMFEARLRLERSTNDFSNWLATSLDEKQLAVKIARLDPYTCTAEELRKKMLVIIDKRIAELKG